MLWAPGRNQRSLKASVSSTICLRSESDTSCTVEGYLGSIWLGATGKLAREADNLHNYSHGQKSWDTLQFGGVFQFTSVQPLPSPHHHQCWRCVSRIFFHVSTLYRVGVKRTAKKIEKDALFYEGTEKWKKNMNSAALSKGLLSTIVALKFKF